MLIIKLQVELQKQQKLFRNKESKTKAPPSILTGCKVRKNA